MQIEIKADCKCTCSASAARWAFCQLGSDPGCSNPPVSPLSWQVFIIAHFVPEGCLCSTNTNFPMPLRVENSERNTCQKEAFTTFHMFPLKNWEISDPFHASLPLPEG